MRCWSNLEDTLQVVQNRPNSTALVYRVTLRRFQRFTSRILNLRTLTARSFTSGGRGRIAQSKRKAMWLLWSRRESLLYVLSTRSCNSSFEKPRESRIPWDQCSWNGILCRDCCGSFKLYRSRESHYRGRSLISIVVNCCQISIVPRTWSKRSLHCTYCIFHSVSITTIYCYFILFFSMTKWDANEKKKLYALSSWRCITHPWCKLCMLSKYTIKLWTCNWDNPVPFYVLDIILDIIIILTSLDSHFK